MVAFLFYCLLRLLLLLLCISGCGFPISSVPLPFSNCFVCLFVHWFFAVLLAFVFFLACLLLCARCVAVPLGSLSFAILCGPYA